MRDYLDLFKSDLSGLCDKLSLAEGCFNLDDLKEIYEQVRLIASTMEHLMKNCDPRNTDFDGADIETAVRYWDRRINESFYTGKKLIEIKENPVFIRIEELLEYLHGRKKPSFPITSEMLFYYVQEGINLLNYLYRTDLIEPSQLSRGTEEFVSFLKDKTYKVDRWGELIND